MIVGDIWAEELQYGLKMFTQETSRPCFCKLTRLKRCLNYCKNK